MPRAHYYGRFSSTEQGRGGSQERQDRGFTSFCERKGLQGGVTYFDRGKSSYHGTARLHGQLARILQDCTNGQITAGDFLVIENVDRLSRESPGPALKTFISILEHGVKIVILQPSEVEFSWDTLDQMKLFQFVLENCRGHSESAAKSLRSKAFWERRRKALEEGDTLTRMVPCWVDVTKDAKRILNDNARIIQQIFKLSSKGYGTHSIIQKLKKEGIFIRYRNKDGSITKRGWQQATVARWLRDENVLGVFRPGKYIYTDGKRRSVPTGQVIPDYFPRLISDELFAKVQAAINARSNGGKPKGGRISEDVSNLFTGICFDNGKPMAVNRSRRLPYFCRLKGKLLRYEYFERAMLSWILEIKLSPDGHERETLMAVLKDKEAAISTMRKQIAARPNLVILYTELDGLIAEKKKLETTLASMSPESDYGHKRSCELIRLLDTAQGKEREEIRRELKANISILVKRIDVVVTGGRVRKEVFSMVQLGTGQCVPIWFECNRMGDFVSGLWRLEGAEWSDSVKNRMVQFRRVNPDLYQTRMTIKREAKDLPGPSLADLLLMLSRVIPIS